MSEHLSHEVANHSNLIRDLMVKVKEIEAFKKTTSGLVVPASAIPGPGASTVSRPEFQRVHTGLVNEIEALKAELAVVSSVAFEAVRILDRIAGMGE